MIRVESVNLARASVRTIDGKSVLTAIGKQPVAGQAQGAHGHRPSTPTHKNTTRSGR
jgi:hypothetical protein